MFHSRRCNLNMNHGRGDIEKIYPSDNSLVNRMRRKSEIECTDNRLSYHMICTDQIADRCKLNISNDIRDN